MKPVLYFLMAVSAMAQGTSMGDANSIPLGYKLRMQWLVELFGQPSGELPVRMESTGTTLRIVEFPPQEVRGKKREYWTYATNGMSENKMPGATGPKVDPRKRLELMVYTAKESKFAYELLGKLAEYPFENNTALGHNQTMPFSHPDLPWAGLLFAEPLAEPEGMDVQRRYPQPNAADPSVTFIVQICGLHPAELEYAIKHGGKAFSNQTFGRVRQREGFWSLLLFDLPREPIELPKRD